MAAHSVFERNVANWSFKMSTNKKSHEDYGDSGLMVARAKALLEGKG
jgi:hypothetical protein